ncbi:MAG TPA: hypothetical protein P5026_08045 [Kiritimatiellia bacterium]|nr:hypothetical protein [Kiritimatiellia bacterium]HRU71048.1 hypothetical protein [Kiritimatiellia bacterium]
MDFISYGFHIAALIFWVRFWSAPTREFYFNPFLSGTIRMTDSVFAFLRPVLFMPERAAALVVLLFVLLFKTVVAWRFGGEWLIRIGQVFAFAPMPTTQPAVSLFTFSVLQAAVFILRLWTLYLLVRLITPPFRTSRAGEALAFFVRPFSRMPVLLQPLCLLALHGILAFSLVHTCTVTQAPMPDAAPPINPFLTGPIYAQLLKTCWLAALSLNDGLMFLTRGLFVLIIANFGAALLQARGVAIVCSEGVELLLGRFARRGGTGMGFDFTPLIFFFVVDLLYSSISRFLFQLIHSPLFN